MMMRISDWWIRGRTDRRRVDLQEDRAAIVQEASERTHNRMGSREQAKRSEGGRSLEEEEVVVAEARIIIINSEAVVWATKEVDLNMVGMETVVWAIVVVLMHRLM